MNSVFTFGSYSQHLHRKLLNHCGLCNCSWCAWWHCRLFEPCSIFGCSSLQREQLRRIEVGILATARPGGPATRWIAASGHAPICWTEQQKQHWKEYQSIHTGSSSYFSISIEKLSNRQNLLSETVWGACTSSNDTWRCHGIDIRIYPDSISPIFR